jgi:hypothetical protein
VQLVFRGGVGEKKVVGWVVKGRLGKWCGVGMGSSSSSSSRRSDKKKGAAKDLIGGST